MAETNRSILFNKSTRMAETNRSIVLIDNPGWLKRIGQLF